jgi:hypothetical protein
MMTEGQADAWITDAGLESLLQRAIRITLIIGLVASLVLWIATGWRTAAMMATGAGISAASIYEWRRLAQFIAARMDQKPVTKGASLAIVFFMIRLTVFAGAIYVSLKCFQGSAIALFCGLALAVLAIVWETLRLLR